MKKQQFLIENHQKINGHFHNRVVWIRDPLFWIWIDLEKITEPDSDLVCTARLDPDPVNIRPDPKPCP